MADDKTPEEIQAEKEAAAAAEKEAEEKAAAEAAETEKKSKIKVEDGKVTLSEQDYNNLVNMKDDMVDYKGRYKKAESELQAKKEADEKKRKEQLEKDQKFKELYDQSEKEKAEMKTKFNNQALTNALTVKALELNIRKAEYIKLIDKSMIKMDEDTKEFIGIEDVVKTFKEQNPELFKSDNDATSSVDTSHGSRSSGIMTDDEVRQLPPADVMAAKKDNPSLYARWKKLCSQGKTIPG
jgi:hypothetical protein